ncbi:kinase-like domain-containing protein [Chytridium lagenaria]|nr:kinase-like domain-containing protein [Chytridium lagenaria]
MASDRYWPQKRVSPDMPNVWYGLDQETNEPVVMKMTERENASDSERNHRVKQEATVLKDLSHAAPHRIINYRNFFLNDEDQFVLVMERAACTVGDVLDQRCLSEEETKVMIRAVLEGLQIIHKNYFCHRDIKPANLMLVDRNDLNGLKIGDFGICVSENGYSGLSGVKGTRGFMAPEVGKGTYGRPVDIWSAGAVAFKALLGRVPPVIPKQKGFPFGRKSSLTFEGPPLSSEAKDFLSKLLDSDPENSFDRRYGVAASLASYARSRHLSNSLQQNQIVLRKLFRKELRVLRVGFS